MKDIASNTHCYLESTRSQEEDKNNEKKGGGGYRRPDIWHVAFRFTPLAEIRDGNDRTLDPDAASMQITLFLTLSFSQHIVPCMNNPSDGDDVIDNLRNQLSSRSILLSE